MAKKNKKVKKVTYKLWIQIEKRTEFEDGTDSYKDVNNEAGVAFSLTNEMEISEEEAIKIAENIETIVKSQSVV